MTFSVRASGTAAIGGVRFRLEYNVVSSSAGVEESAQLRRVVAESPRDFARGKLVIITASLLELTSEILVEKGQRVTIFGDGVRITSTTSTTAAATTAAPVAGRHFNVRSGGQLSLTGMTLVGGVASDTTGEGRLGGSLLVAGWVCAAARAPPRSV